MTPTFSAAEFEEATGGVWWCERRCRSPLALSTDSRERGDAPRALVALAGEKFDAHDFLEQALANGAAALVVAADRVGKLPSAVRDGRVPALVVPDTLRAYQALARFHRRRFPRLKLAAVTGSVGKTSVKEMLRAIFAAEAGPDAVLYTIGNTNNQVGVAQNLLRLTPAHRFAVIEMGTNHHGEIAPLSAMAEPTAALINTIAPCHLEFLGDLDGVAREKSRIFDALAADGVAVYPAEACGVVHIRRAAGAFRRIEFGSGASTAVRGEYVEGDLAGSRVRISFGDGGDEIEFSWRLSGAHQAVNASGAAALALALGVGRDSVARGLAACELPGMRMKIVEHGGVRWINDAYNANPESMAALLRQLAATATPELTVMLGDMLELGPDELEWHRRTARTARELLPEARLLLVGPRFGAALAAEMDAWEWFADAAAAGACLAASLNAGATVVLKASRGLRLEAALPPEVRDAAH